MRSGTLLSQFLRDFLPTLEGIIILLIYFLNCRKAFFTKKYVSFSKKYTVKIIRLAVFRGIP